MSKKFKFSKTITSSCCKGYLHLDEVVPLPFVSTNDFSLDSIDKACVHCRSVIAGKYVGSRFCIVFVGSSDEFFDFYYKGNSCKGLFVFSVSLNISPF